MTFLSHTTIRRSLIPLILLVLASGTFAFQPKKPDRGLDQKEFSLPELYISNLAVPMDHNVLQQLPNRASWQAFFSRNGSKFQIYLDPRSATPMNVAGHVPLIPGKGADNHLTLKALSVQLGRNLRNIGPSDVADLFAGWLSQNKEAFGIDMTQMGPVKATRVNDFLWHIYIPQEVRGVPVRYGRLTGTVNHGNLILAGTENWGNVKINVRPTISAADALRLGFQFAGGRLQADRMWKKPELEIFPIAPPQFNSGEAFVGPLGAGYGHRLAWVFGFQRTPEIQRWEIVIDAHTSEVISFTDKNDYIDKKIRGGVYPLTNTFICPDNPRCGIMQPDTPMPWVDTGLPGPNNFTNSAGVFEFSAGQTATTTFNGLYMKMTDTCGAASESAAGNVNLGGVNGDTDCLTGGSSPGNTPASRSGFYELNKLAEAGRGYLPGNTWLQSQLTANMNLHQTCNAFWDGTTVNFFLSGGGCRNTGEIAAVFDHEWGHGLDNNDSNGQLSNSSEGYADIAAMYRLWASCVGYGFFETFDLGCGQTIDGTGYNWDESQVQNVLHCDTDCSGVRDSDWAKHFDGLPDDVSFVCSLCQGGGGQQGGGGGGPCGRQVHCAATPVRQAAWDLVARDLPAAGFDANTSFIIGDKLFYQGSGNIGNWHNCTCPSAADGCGASNAYMQWLAADDDNGNIADGTPHMAAVYAAYNRHGIACASPAPTNGGCSGGPTSAPAVTTTASHNQITLNWNSISGASSYFVFRGEGYAGCNFGKALIATVNQTSYIDNDVSNGRTYSYVVMAVGSSSSCFSPASPCVQAAPQPCKGAVEFDAAVYSCEDSLNIQLLDSDLIGQGTHNVGVSSTTESAPEIVALTESITVPGEFSGSITSTSAPPASDGLLSLTHGDTITVSYADASFCGPPQQVNSTAIADCVAPVISNLQISNVTASAATFTWSTDEVSDSTITVAPAPGPPNSSTNLPALTTSHAVTVTGLNQCTDYVSSVSSTDLATNTVTDNNGGAFYPFTTGGIGAIFSDDAEAGLNNWVAAGGGTSMWHVSTCQANSGTQSFKAGSTTCGTVYDDNVFTTLTTANIIPIGQAGNGYHLTYNERYDTEIVDKCRPQISLDGGNSWVDIDNYSGTSNGWISKDYDLSAFGSPNARIRFLFTSDTSGGDQGWYIDDIKISRIAPCGVKLQHFTELNVDDCSSAGPGDADGVIDPGETIQMTVSTENFGLSGATGISATLSTTDPGVTITVNSTTFPDVPAQGIAVANSPFTFEVSANMACRSQILFKIDFTSNEGSWSDTFAVTVGGGDPFTILSENFGSGIPASWTVIDGGSGGGAASTWTTSNPGGRIIDPPFDTQFAIVDAPAAGIFATQDEILVTPSFDASTCLNVTLDFSNQFHFFSESTAEIGDVDVSVDGGNNWTNVLQMTNLDDGYPIPNTKSLDLSSVAAFQPDVKVRFHYYLADFEAFWWAIDNVNLTCQPQICHDCSAGCLFCDNFNDNILASNWNYVKPGWTENGGSLIGTPTGRKAIAVATPAFGGCQNCTAQTTMKSAGGTGNRVWLLAWHVDKRNVVELLMNEESNKWILKQRVNGAVVAKTKASSQIDPNVFYNVTVSFDGTQFHVTVDGVLLFSLTARAPVPNGTVGFQVKATTGSFDLINVN